MNRLGFIASAVWTSICAAFGMPKLAKSSAESVPEFAPILTAFPSTGKPNEMSFFMTLRNFDDPIGVGNMAFSIINKTGYSDMNIDDVVSEVETWKIKPEIAKHVIFKMVKAADKVAKKSRRGAANTFYRTNDSILVWYQGNTAFDGPIQRKEDKLVLNDNYKEYFVKLEFDPNSFDQNELTELLDFAVKTRWKDATKIEWVMDENDKLKRTVLESGDRTKIG